MLSCSVPNQTLITAWYRIDLKDSKRFAPTDVESIQMASRDLPGGAAFRIWMALCSESNATKDLSKQRHTWALSPAFFETTWGISKSSYYRALKELQEKNYLVKTGPNTFAFYERPRPSKK